MNIAGYNLAKEKAGYNEQLTYVVASETSLRGFFDCKAADLEVKAHLSKVIICRHFSSTGGILLPEDVSWFINCFLREYKTDLIKPWISEAIREAINMIVSECTFSKVIVGMSFMFGVVEFYTKYRLGWRPELFDYFDDANQKKYRNMHLYDAINRLKKTNWPLARDLNYIDTYNVSALKESGIPERRYTKARIADRLTLARNSMLHGEDHSFYSTGKYLVMIYVLFHFHGLIDDFKYEGK